MAHAVLALGAALVTASGCVWYVPALAELRAGADRPDFRRTAAAACLTGWSTTAAVAVLLLVADAWWAPVGTAAVGAAATAGLRIRAAVRRRYEAREIARHWAALRHTAPPDHRGDGPTRYTFVALVGSGLLAALVVAAVLLAAGPEDGGDWLLAVTAPAAVVGVFLAVAATHARGRSHAGR
ncbi:hypothetical protein IM697_28205 [Streptomyces ferrugineus]|uniref:Uncharacterized protein n=1 Tax=Streptomyces ferrugineus TaxID=1413221 RepID=A0A7M2SCI0_9ACTN|nr:hypothetical protein [Streptomyces ferrugineus]QOV34040.1 hypothetical protein IM697_28205 [Streptomyces ferrugineus]